MFIVNKDDVCFDYDDLLKKSIITTDMAIPRAKTILSKNDTDVFTAGNISVIQGAEKSRKTFAMMLFNSLLINQSSTFKSNVESIVIFDTEQYKFHTQRFLNRLKLMTGNISKVTILNLRSMRKAERCDFIETYILNNKPTIAFIDNIRDLIGNFNDVDQSDAIITMLSNLSESTATHICCTIHIAKSTGQARGHVGSELMQKAETVFDIKAEEYISFVHPKFTRGKAFDGFSFKINDDGLPEINSDITYVNKF